MSKYVVLVIITVVYVILGCFMDSFGMMILTIPILLPTLLTLGFDPIWFGVYIVIVCEMGLITPPLGLNVFVVAGVAQDVPLYSVFRGVLPFLGIMLLLVIILAAFPQIVLFLPNLISG